MVRDTKEVLSDADCIVTFYGKGHDKPLINTRLARWGYKPLRPVHHIDMFFIVKHNLKTARKSQAHLLEFLQDTMQILGLPKEEKMTVGPHIWADLWTHYPQYIKILQKRCESDVLGLEVLYKALRGIIKDVKRD